MKKLQSLTFITGNAVKAQAIKKHLDFPLEHCKLNLNEIQSLDLNEVVTFKALEAYRQIKQPVLVEDTTLTFLALGQLPGTFIKWFEKIGNEKLCRMLDPYSDRSAIYEIALCLYDGEEVKIFKQASKGTISDKPRGDGFGWNSIFMYEGHDKTLAELTEEQRAPFSVRTKVIKQLEEFLHHNQPSSKVNKDAKETKKVE